METSDEHSDPLRRSSVRASEGFREIRNPVLRRLSDPLFIYIAMYIQHGGADACVSKQGLNFIEKRAVLKRNRGGRMAKGMGVIRRN